MTKWSWSRFRSWQNWAWDPMPNPRIAVRTVTVFQIKIFKMTSSTTIPFIFWKCMGNMKEKQINLVKIRKQAQKSFLLLYFQIWMFEFYITIQHQQFWLEKKNTELWRRNAFVGTSYVCKGCTHQSYGDFQIKNAFNTWKSF